MAGSALPSWLLHPGPVLLRRHVRNKCDPLCDPVELMEGNQTYSVIRLGDGQETTVSTSWLSAFSQVSSYCRRADNRRRLEYHDSEGCAQCLTRLPWPSAACRWVARVNLPVAEYWLLSVTAVCRCATPTSVNEIKKIPWSFWWLVRIISKGGRVWRFRCPRLPALISPLINYVPRWIALLCLVVCIARRYQIVSSFVPGGCCVTLHILMRAGVLSWIKGFVRRWVLSWHCVAADSTITHIF